MAQQLHFFDLPRRGSGQFEVLSEEAVAGPDGTIYDVHEAIRQLPWVRQLCPSMPHEYCVRDESDRVAYAVVQAMISGSPRSFDAYWRGYRNPNRYWPDGDSGFRYWTSASRSGKWVTLMLNRTDAPDDTRRLDEGGTVARSWDGPPWAPDGAGLYYRDRTGRWWPTDEAIASGYIPCKYCRRRR